MFASTSVDLAASTDSILIPVKSKDYDGAPYSSMLADLYSGVPHSEWVVQKPDYANFASEEILSISKQVPIIELATTFNSAEIKRFQEIILSISQHEANIDELGDAISAFNYFVKQYEKDAKNLNFWNIQGFVLGAIGKRTGIPFASWILKNALKYSSRNLVIGKIFNRLEAEIVGAYPNAILVSRMRDKIKNKL